MHEGFTVKELFEDLNSSEIYFLNRALKKAMECEGAPMLPKRIVAGERFESNQWPNYFRRHAIGLLVGFRKTLETHGYVPKAVQDELIETYVEMPIQKWGLTPNFTGEWEGYARHIGVDPDGIDPDMLCE